MRQAFIIFGSIAGGILALAAACMANTIAWGVFLSFGFGLIAFNDWHARRAAKRGPKDCADRG